MAEAAVIIYIYQNIAAISANMPVAGSAVLQIPLRSDFLKSSDDLVHLMLHLHYLHYRSSLSNMVIGVVAGTIFRTDMPRLMVLAVVVICSKTLFPTHHGGCNTHISKINSHLIHIGQVVLCNVMIVQPQTTIVHIDSSCMMLDVPPIPVLTSLLPCISEFI